MPVPALAFCPGAPVLVPELAAGAADELEGLRAACAEALLVALSTAPDRVVAVGTGANRCEHPGSSSGSLVGFGRDVRAGGPDDPPGLPPALTLAAWHLDRVGWTGPRSYLELPADSPPARCAEVGSALAASPDRLVLLVVGDGSARRTAKAPGALDPRAEPFDRVVAAGLAAADAAALAALDQHLAAELLADGRAPWQVAAAAWGGAAADRGTARLLADEAPYGVGYLVAVWSR